MTTNAPVPAVPVVAPRPVYPRCRIPECGGVCFSPVGWDGLCHAHYTEDYEWRRGVMSLDAWRAEMGA